MRLPIFCFALGIWWCQQQPVLPAPATVAWLFAACLACLVGTAMRPARHQARLRSLCLAAAAAGIGFAWAAIDGQGRLAEVLARADEGRDIQVEGIVASLPQRIDRGRRFHFQVERAEGAALPRHISLAWYQGRQELVNDELNSFQEVHAGERWRLTVRLKRPHGNVNPGGFDFEGWLFEQGIRATGYVRTSALVQPNERLAAFVPRFNLGVERLREAVRERFLVALPDAEYVGVLVALAVGDQQAIDSDLWLTFARTGITHLMSISGLHVTMVAAIGWWLVALIWRRHPALALRLPVQKAAAVGGVLAAFAYCLLAGFGVPAQRTLYMVGTVALALWSGRNVAVSRILALALLVVLLLDPLAVLAAGFWLSFGAVGILFYTGSGRIGREHWLAGWGRAQWSVTLGMLPALLALFQQFSLVSPLANALAIPVVTFIVTPLALLGALLGAVLPLDAPLLLAHWVMEWLMVAMEWLAGLPRAAWQQAAPPSWSVVLGLAGCALVLLPAGFPGRWWGALLLLPLALLRPERPQEGEMRLTVLDVGQGLAAHVQTRTSDLIYDTGPLFTPDANSGNRILVPYLRAVGVSRLDGVVITHQDTDHSGGAASLLEAVPADWVASSLPPTHVLRAGDRRHRPCFAGQRWRRDGVEFEMLYPDFDSYASPARKTNDMSCVLKISTASGSVLLTSDIEALSEWRLVRQDAGKLRADVMTMPHHGSRTSSTPAFIDAVGAPLVVIPVGYRSRFGHPKAEVVERYRARGIRLLRTDLDGAVTLSFAAGRVTAETERPRQLRYWQDRAEGG